MTERIKLIHARFTPDGGDLVVSQVRDGVMNLSDAESANRATRVRSRTIMKGRAFRPVSDDGRWIAFEVIRGGDVHLAIVPSSGGEARVLTSGRGLYWPHSFAPDGDRIAVAYRTDGLWRLGAISRTTGQLVPLSAPVPASSFVRYPALVRPQRPRRLRTRPGDGQHLDGHPALQEASRARRSKSPSPQGYRGEVETFPSPKDEGLIFSSSESPGTR